MVMMSAIARAGSSMGGGVVSRTLRRSSAFTPATGALLSQKPPVLRQESAGPSRNIRTMPIVMMGRRSAKIAGKKGKEDAIRAKLYGKIGKQIVQTVKQAGPDPVANQHLGDLLKIAKAANVPKDLIDRNIKKASDKSQAEYTSTTYEAYGVGGVGMVIESMTDNINRAAADVRDAINKGGGKVAESGSVLFNFSRVGWIFLKPGADEETVFDVAIDAGAEDVVVGEDEDGNPETKVVTAMDHFGAVRDALSKAGVEMWDDRSGLVYAPLAAVDLSDDDYDANMALVERILEVDDVDAVHTGFDQ